MHFEHVYLVEADDESDARHNVESFLEGYGEGNVYDYYTIKEIYFEEAIVKLTSENAVKIWLVIERQIKDMNAEYKIYWQWLFQEMEKHNVTDLSELKIGDDAHMIGYYMRRIGSLVSNYFSSDSHFYWIEQDSMLISKEEFLKVASEGKHFIVTADLHN